MLVTVFALGTAAMAGRISTVTFVELFPRGAWFVDADSSHCGRSPAVSTETHLSIPLFVVIQVTRRTS
eukprot:m.304789 g.304789  ORF g.304789 m.304789 type:complete len:68 (+) comp16339_c0_seq20:64-267(+)